MIGSASRSSQRTPSAAAIPTRSSRSTKSRLRVDRRIQPKAMALPEDLFFPPQTRIDDGTQIRVTWLGTAGFLIEQDPYCLLIDPYLTRASLSQCVLAPLQVDVA